MILTGDCLKTLKTLRAGSHDACFCDPPYGLSFMGKAWDHGVPGAEVWAEVLRVLKPGAPLLAFGGTRTFHRLACAIEDGGFILSDTLCWLHGQGFPKGHAQLKPAWEPITLAWKKGPRVLAIDAARIPTADKLGGGQDTTGRQGAGEGWRRPWMEDPQAIGASIQRAQKAVAKAESLGRWPANVLLDEVSAAALDAQSGTLKSGARTGHRNQPKTKNSFGAFALQMEQPSIASEGGASRFFYCAKASRSERNAGLEGMPAGPVGEKKGRNRSLNSAMRMENGVATGPKADSSASQNTHPTVKPVKLTEYLARLILPANPKAKLLVPFSGSGSEMLGAKRAGWKHITGIEMQPEYVEIAERRMDASRNVERAEPRTKGRNAFTEKVA